MVVVVGGQKRARPYVEADIKHNIILDKEQQTSSEAYNCHFLTTINLHLPSGFKAYSQGI